MMDKKQAHTRLFSLGDDFMNFKIDDLLYGFMRSLSTARPVYEEGKAVKWQEYLLKKEFTKSKKVIAGICGCSTRTIDRHLNDLFARGLLEEGFEVIENNKKEYEYPCFWFPHNESNPYKIVEKDLVRYLVDTRNAQCIKVYLYLLNKYEWKEDYTFTLKEIQMALGYSSDCSSARTTVSNILDSFAREGIIKYENTYEYVEENGEVHKIPRKVLKFVATSIKELRKLD